MTLTGKKDQVITYVDFSNKELNHTKALEFINEAITNSSDKNPVTVFVPRSLLKKFNIQVNNSSKSDNIKLSPYQENGSLVLNNSNSQLLIAGADSKEEIEKANTSIIVTQNIGKTEKSNEITTEDFSEDEVKEGIDSKISNALLEEIRNYNGLRNSVNPAHGGGPGPNLAPSTNKKKKNNKILPKHSSSVDMINFAHKSLQSKLDSNINLKSAAIAAGDDINSNNKSVWVKGMYGSNMQNKTEGHIGSRGNIWGAATGFDIESESGTIYGVSYAHLVGKYKYQDLSKSDISSNVFSIYGQGQKGNIVIRAVASFAKSNVKIQNYIDSEDILTSGKFRNTSYALTSMVGYKIQKSNFEIMPFIGLGYTHSSDSAYAETGRANTADNRKYGKQSSSSCTGSIGARISKNIISKSRTIFIPYLTGFVERDLKTNKQKISVEHTGARAIDLSTNKDFEQAKFGYSAGTGISIRSNNIELSVDYLGNFKKKYKAHQGSIKLKLFL